MISEPNSAAMSIEEYLALDRASLDVRYEYIDGVVTMLGKHPHRSYLRKNTLLTGHVHHVTVSLACQ